MRNYVVEGQLSLFDLMANLGSVSTAPAMARCIATGEMCETRKPTSDELRLVTDGKYTILVDKKPYVLQETDFSESDIREGYKFFHYVVNGRVYDGTFAMVGCI